jgi:hypothetical protein
MENNRFLTTESPNNWTREEYRNMQLTINESKCLLYKEQKNWDLCLNSIEDWLSFDIELIEETITTIDEEGKTHKEKKYGMNTNIYKETKAKIRKYRNKIGDISGRATDPARRKNNEEEAREVTDEIRDLIDFMFNLNRELGVTYRRQIDPKKAALG